MAHLHGISRKVALEARSLLLNTKGEAHVQEHRFSFVADGSPSEVWEIFLSQHRQGVETEKVRIEILNQGDDASNGMIRHCTFPVPRYLLSGGVAHSWEWITGAVAPISWHFDAISKPLWSRSAGQTTLEPLEDGRTRVTFVETYEAFNPLARLLLENRVHRFISKDNNDHFERSVANALARAHEQEPSDPWPGE
jgi:hypothetical protein